MAEVHWDMWDFDYLETDLLNYARENNLEYDKKHPFSVLPTGAPKMALDAAGGSYAEIAKFMPADVSTVAGWFRPGREPSRGTVAKSIFPVLCEVYARNNEDEMLRFHFERLNYIYDGQRPSKDYIRMIQHRVFLLLTTGQKITDDERKNSMQRNLYYYYENVLHFSACFLSSDEIKTLAQTALYMLRSHTTEKEPERIIDQEKWVFYADNHSEQVSYPASITIDSSTPFKPSAADYPWYAGYRLRNAAIISQVENLSYHELSELVDAIKEIQAFRDEEMFLVQEQMEENGYSYDADDTDEEVWDHWEKR